MLKKVLCAVILPLSMVQSYTSSTTTCLMMKKLYHIPTNTCLTPLLQGPCTEGEWVVMEGSSNTGVCRPRTICTVGRTAALNPSGGVVCACPEGMEEVSRSCELLFSQNMCKKGEILMPDTFAVGSKICSAGFSCIPAKDCEAFQKAKKEVWEKGTWKRKEQMKFLREMICDNKSRSICSPDTDVHSLFSIHNLLQSMQHPKVKCVSNPCRQGLWPWVGKDGISKCLKGEKKVENCPTEIVEEDGELFCNLIYLKTVSPKQGYNCGRRRRWIYGRCMRIFG